MGMGTLFLGTDSSGGINLSAELIPYLNQFLPKNLIFSILSPHLRGGWETDSYGAHIYTLFLFVSKL
jgi:hypothetical protein